MPSRDNHSDFSDSLPGEIWYRIAVFVPLEDFFSYRLYALNRYFLLFYLEEKYKQVELRFIHPSGCRHPKFLAAVLGPKNSSPTAGNCIRSPMISRLVRNLEIEIREREHLLHNLPRKGIEKLLTTMVGRWMKWTRLEASVRDVKSWFCTGHCRRVCQTLSHFAGLHTISIKIRYTHHESLPELSPGDFILRTISPAWRASQETLTSLTFIFEAVSIPNIGLNDDSNTFPNLDSFEFILRPSGHASKFNEQLEEVLEKSSAPLSRFLQRHAGGLRQLSLSFPTCQFSSKIINAIPYMRKLSVLSLCLCPEVTDTGLMEGLSQVLSIHSQNIQQLWLSLQQRVMTGWPEDLDSAPPGWWERQNFMEVKLPSIKFLCLYFVNKSAMYQYVRKVAPKVGTLYLDGGPSPGLRFNDIELFTSQSFQATLQNGCHLHTLGLSLFTITPGILRHFTMHFPNLKVLRLRYFDVGTNDLPHWEEPEHVLAQFVLEPLGFWGLEELFLHQYDKYPTYDLGLEDAAYRSAIAKFLPNVKYFNGLQRVNFMQAGKVEGITTSGAQWPNTRLNGQTILLY